MGNPTNHPLPWRFKISVHSLSPLLSVHNPCPESVYTSSRPAQFLITSLSYSMFHSFSVLIHDSLLFCLRFNVSAAFSAHHLFRFFPFILLVFRFFCYFLCFHTFSDFKSMKRSLIAKQNVSQAPKNSDKSAYAPDSGDKTKWKKRKISEK